MPCKVAYAHTLGFRIWAPLGGGSITLPTEYILVVLLKNVKFREDTILMKQESFRVFSNDNFRKS